MKFKIVEQNRHLTRAKFIPKYKTCIIWHNISDVWWTDSIFNENKFFYENGYVWTLKEAYDIVEKYEGYLERNQNYDKTHYIDE